MSKKVSHSCSVCNDKPGKYKCIYCPTIYYCSVTCYKKHQELSCVKTNNDQKTDNNNDNNNQTIVNANNNNKQQLQPYNFIPMSRPTDITSHTTTDALNEYDYYCIENNAHLIKQLQYSNELQNIIKQIDTSYDRQGTLIKYMKNNNKFNQFVDELLTTLKT